MQWRCLTQTISEITYSNILFNFSYSYSYVLDILVADFDDCNQKTSGESVSYRFYEVQLWLQSLRYKISSLKPLE